MSPVGDGSVIETGLDTEAVIMSAAGDDSVTDPVVAQNIRTYPLAPAPPATFDAVSRQPPAPPPPVVLPA